MSPDEVTPEWLSEVTGHDIQSIETSRIGDGLVGLNLRVELVAGPRANSKSPSSLVLKLPSLDPTSRASGVSLRNYEREVKFYREIASTVDIRVPHCWFGDWHEPSGDFVLVLEDMAPAAQGDQLTGCDVSTARASVRELARLHGPRWGDPTLSDIDWLNRTGANEVAILEALWAQFLGPFLTGYRQHLNDPMVDVLDRFGDALADWISDRTGPLTVSHGDFRLDNLLFATDAGGPPVTAVDWQTPGQAQPTIDLSYFLGAGLLPEDRRDHERPLIDEYVDALRPYDIDVDRDWLFDGYRRESFAGVVMAVVASQLVGESERSERMFAAMAIRHLQQAIDLDALAALGH